jgi:DNA-binding IscR family transcriptional regulator
MAMDMTLAPKMILCKLNALQPGQRLTSRHLQSDTGLSDVIVRNIIRDLRKDPSVKDLIGSDGGGYYIISDQEEYAHTIAWIMSRISEIVEVKDALETKWQEQKVGRVEQGRLNLQMAREAAGV